MMTKVSTSDFGNKVELQNRMIMREKKFFLAPLLVVGVFLTSCSSDDPLELDNELENENGKVSEIRATLNDFLYEDGLTRTAYTISDANGFGTVWAARDVLDVYSIGGDRNYFIISEGEGTTSAKFICFLGLRGEKFAAYYPFSMDYYTFKRTAIPVSYLEQTQDGNNTTSHLAAVDFMAAAGTKQSASGSVNMSFKHVGCLLRMQFTMPKAGTFTSVTIATDDGNFTTEGTVNLTDATPALSATSTDTELTLGLTNVQTTADNQTITLFMMVAPDNLSSRTLTFIVRDNAGKTYAKTDAGKNMIASYAYNYSLTFSEGVDVSGSYNGHEYVDLMLPSGLKWATCNVGAASPEDYGDYFAWGETEPYYTEGHARDKLCSDWKTGKTGYNWESYKWCIDGSYYGLTKYNASYFYGTTIDNKTVLEPADDAASANWGGSWRMPTYSEFRELVENCTLTEIYNGWKLTGINGNWIILPNAGYREDRIFYYSDGDYWTSTVDTWFNQAYVQCFGPLFFMSRCVGLCVRPVTE